MNYKLLLCLCVLLCTILSSVSALTASLGNSRMILRANVTPEVPAVLSASIIVNNENENPISIKVEPDDVLAYNLSIEILPRTFILQKGESKELPFVLKVLGPGSYSGKIYVTYSMNNTKNGTTKTENAGMIANIIVLAQGPVGIYPESPQKPENETPPQVLINSTPVVPIIPAPNATQQNTTVQPTPVPEPENGNPSAIVGAIIVLIIVSLGMIIYFLVEKKR